MTMVLFIIEAPLICAAKWTTQTRFQRRILYVTSYNRSYILSFFDHTMINGLSDSIHYILYCVISVSYYLLVILFYLIFVRNLIIEQHSLLLIKHLITLCTSMLQLKY